MIVTSITDKSYRLTVRLLVTGTGTWTTELLWLAASVVGNEKSTVVCNESLLQLVLAVLIDVLLVVGDLHILNQFLRSFGLGNCIISLDHVDAAAECLLAEARWGSGHTMLLAIA